MRTFYSILLFCFIAVSAYCAVPADAIVARVNGEVIMLSQLREVALDSDVPLSDLTMQGLTGEGFRRTLTLQVDETLLYQRAMKDGIKLDEVTLARDIDRIIQELQRQLGSREGLDRFLKEHSLSFDEFRDMLGRREKRRMLATDVVARRIKTDAASVAAFEKKLREEKKPTETLRLAHVLFAVKDKQSDSAAGGRAYAAAVALARKAAADPTRFAELARAKSDDRATRGEGGDLGWLDPATLRPALRDAAAELRPGDVSEPVWGGGGWHVLQLVERREVRDIYFAEAFERERAKLIGQLRKEASIKIYNPNK